MRRSVIADNMPVSGIRKMFALASEYENVINLCIGEPDFATPQHIIDCRFICAESWLYKICGKFGTSRFEKGDSGENDC